MATILIIDDRPVNRELLTTLLGYAGHRLLEAADGQAGLALARAEHPDLIITDIVMPTMDGYEFARLVRADAMLNHTPVVFYTSSYVVAETRQLAEACGVAHIIAKPAEPEDILRTVGLALASTPAPVAAPASDAFHEEHMRLLTNKLSAKVDELEAENSERQRVAQALQASEAELRALFAAMTDVIIVLDQDGTYLKIAPTNPAEEFRLPPALIGRRLHDAFKPEQADGFVAAIRQALASQRPLATEYATEVGGRTVWFEAVISPMGPDSVFLVARDISARRQAEAALRESEEKFKYIFDHSMVGKSITTPAGELTVNQAFSDMMGYTPQELQDHAYGEITHPDDMAMSQAAMASMLAGERESVRFTKRYVHKSGAIVWADVSTALRRDAAGQPLYFMTAVSNITARVQAEERLRDSEVHLRTLFENVPVSIWEEDFSAVKVFLEHLPGGRPADIDAYLSAHPEVVAACVPLVRVVDVNQATLDLLEVADKNELLGGLALAPEGHAAFHQELVTVSCGATRLRHDVLVVTRSGQQREVTLDWALVPGHEHDYARVLVSMVDITERKRAAQALARTNDLLSRAEQIGRIGSFSGDLSTHEVVWSDGLYRLFGLEPHSSDTSFETYMDQVHPADRERVRQAVASAVQTQGGYQYESRIVRADGQERVIQSRGEAQRDAQGRPLRLVGMAIDVTEQRQAEEAQRESERRYQLLFELNPLPMFVVDTATLGFLAVNAATVAHYGYSRDEFLSMTLAGILPPEEMPRVRAAVADSTGQLEQPGIFKHRKKNGTRIDVEIVAHNIIFGAHEARLALAIDVTERLKAESLAQRQLERLAALRAVDNAIIASLDLRLTLQMVLDEITRQLRVDAADIFLLNRQSHGLDYAAGRGFRTGAWPQSSLRLGQGFAGRVALERHTLAVPDLPVPRPAGPRVAAFEAEDFHAYFGVALIAKGQVVGVLEVFHRTALFPEADWIDFLEALAGQAAIAIDNAALFTDLQLSNQSLSLAYDATIEGWSRALDLRDHETEGHSQRVTELTLQLAAQMGFEPAAQVHIRRGALLHDIGKMAIPDGVLLKPGPLNDEEWVIMRQHPVFAYQLLAPIHYLHEALDIPYCHHEKWDGTGYPRQLKGETIPLSARIFAVVDVWDALTSDRVYRPGWPRAAARTHIHGLAGTHFDPAVVAAFEQLLDETP